MTIKDLEEQIKISKAQEILNEFYQRIDDILVCYFISLSAPMLLRADLEKYETDYKIELKKEGYTDFEIEKQIARKNHIFSDSNSEFRVQTTTTSLKRILTPGNFENIQAKSAIRTIYDTWKLSI